MKIWAENQAYVLAHNARFDAGLETFDLEMNHFADLNSEEFAEKYLIKIPEDYTKTTKCTGAAPSLGKVADGVDWNAKGAVTRIKNQGQCGSCWAFSTTGSLEGAHYLEKDSLVSFSEQQLVDCSKSYGNHGCGGGLMNFSFFYVKDEGITTEEKYPYRGVGGACHYNKETDMAWTISDCHEVKVNSEEALRAAISHTPVSVAIEANHLSFQLYKSGVYSGNCGTKLDHGVLATGFGVDNTSTSNGKTYYTIKNSWGPGWGEKGYMKMKREEGNTGKGQCGIQMAASYPIA